MTSRDPSPNRQRTEAGCGGNMKQISVVDDESELPRSAAVVVVGCGRREAGEPRVAGFSFELI